MSDVASYKGVLNRYKVSSKSVQEYFSHLPTLLPPNFPYDVALAYLFLRTEKAQNRALYCGVVKLWHASGALAERAVNNQHLTRERFKELYECVFERPLEKSTVELINTAETVRDQVIHGKGVADREIREAIVDVLGYAEALNKAVKAIGGFEPFGDLTGFKGAGKALDNRTSRLVLKGLGFSLR